MDLRPVYFIFGLIIAAIGVAMTVPGLVDAAIGNHHAPAFLISAAFTIFAGVTFILGNRVRPLELGVRQAFLLTSISWICTPAFGALPFLFTDPGWSITDSYFEAVSGLTTTGSTILTGLDHMPEGLLLWRSLLQWIGGIGIVVMAIAILPFLRVGGMQLLRTESSDRSEKILPRPGQVAAYVLSIYLGLTLAAGFGFRVAGMSWFDAMNHAMTTLSTGGFSTHDASFGHFPSPLAHWLGSLFMLAGALPFMLYVKALRGNPGALIANSQIRILLVLIGLSAAVLSVWLWLTDQMSLRDAIRETIFNITSIVSTTGFAAGDYAAWGYPVMGGFLFLTVIGGCTGSTSGAVKIFRWQILAQEGVAQLRRLTHPNRVIVRSYEGQPVPDSVVASVAAFFFVFVATIALLTFAMTLFHVDVLTALSGAATAVANVGPGLGPVIGPSGTFQPLPDPVKWILAAGMLLGRLELMTVLVVLTPGFWRT